MARIADDASGAQSGSNSIRLDADAGPRLDLPSNDFVTNAQILRDGQDLLLRTDDGHEIVVGNYFNAEPAPVLVSAGGAALTPELVDSFVKPLDGVQVAQKGSVDDSSPVGMVREVSGEATVTHPNGIVEKISAGTPIYQGDIVETKADGAVNIIFVDETTFAVSKDARLAIDEYVFDPATQSGETNFSVLRGVFVFTSGLIGRDDPDDVQIDTPVGSIGIRGTTIMGTIDPEGQSYITVVEGAIVVSNGNGEQTLSQQYETVRLDGYSSDIVNDGTLSSGQLSENYNVLRTVNAELFSQIDDTAANPVETAPETVETGTESESAPLPESTGSTTPDTQPAPDSTIQTAPEETLLDAPADSTVSPATKESTTVITTSEPLTLDTDAGFDLSAGTTYTYTSDSATTTTLTSSSTSSTLSATTTTAAAPLPPADFSNQTTTTA
ncbi:MAG: FecR domain-containing protein, partial [Micavibrio aeruginosavorus]|nr:FecR domain-containing protein [Micavibrio aeruginosavorus]